MRLLSFPRLAAAVLVAAAALPTADLRAADKIEPLAIGAAAPNWENLPGVDGKKHALAEFRTGKALVVVFFSNHCIDCQDYVERLTKLAADYKDRGVQVVCLNVGGFDGENLEKMTAWAAEKKFTLPFLRDDSQAVGKAYGAKLTPEAYLFDAAGKLAYRGAIDDHWDPAQVKRAHLRVALDEILAGKPVSTPIQKGEFGCDIDY